jgi:ATP/ADP translocase
MEQKRETEGLDSGENNSHNYKDFVDGHRPAERQGLLPLEGTTKRPKKEQLSIRRKQFDRRLRDLIENPRGDGWMRPYWLGLGLFLVLFPFWLLDSLKDPVFGALIDGNLQEHLPTAKMFSVCMTLCLVCFLEYVAHERDRAAAVQEEERSRDDVLNAGGVWSRMEISNGDCNGDDDFFWDTKSEAAAARKDDRVPSSIFVSIGVPYCIFFGIMAYLLQFNPATALVDGKKGNDTSMGGTSSSQLWHMIGYILYAAIESFGSIAVATFWSYTNSTLSLRDAEDYYGTIIAFAQLGAIVGSTMVTMHIWSNITLFIVACLVILLHILVMITYSRRFRPTSADNAEAEETILPESDRDHHEVSLWSGVYLILKHNYVIFILGVSCLYEVSLTCLNYQMTLLGWNRFEETPNYDPDQNTFSNMSFTQFMGHYGQMVNLSSLVLSSMMFPWLIHRLGLKYTLRLFPTLLLVANLIAFIALPGNLAVLFFSMSLLKAMTYSIHDPAKEILYIPTSNAIKFKAKFWIDVVGARFAKAIGSSINHMSGNVRRSIRVASGPSLLTAAALWYVCYKIGSHFEHLVESGTIVGLHDDPVRMTIDLSAEHDEDGDGRGDILENTEAMELTAL